jgi:hypothetical protein
MRINCIKHNKSDRCQIDEKKVNAITKFYILITIWSYLLKTYRYFSCEGVAVENIKATFFLQSVKQNNKRRKDKHNESNKTQKIIINEKLLNNGKK